MDTIGGSGTIYASTIPHDRSHFKNSQMTDPVQMNGICHTDPVQMNGVRHLKMTDPVHLNRIRHFRMTDPVHLNGVCHTDPVQMNRIRHFRMTHPVHLNRICHLIVFEIRRVVRYRTCIYGGPNFRMCSCMCIYIHIYTPFHVTQWVCYNTTILNLCAPHDTCHHI